MRALLVWLALALPVGAFENDYAALFAAQRQLTTAGRAREYARAEALLLRDLPILPLYRGASNRLISARVRGWVDHPGHAHPSDYLGLA